MSERSNSRNKGDSDQRADSTTVNSLRSFASWKFDVLDALAAGLDAREFQVAYCLLQFANNTTRAICPAQAKIAAILGRDVSSVKRAIARMIELGVLRAGRRNMRVSNAYVFVETTLDQYQTLRKIRLAEYQQQRWGGPDGSDMPRQGASDFEHDGADVSLNGRSYIQVSGEMESARRVVEGALLPPDIGSDLPLHGGSEVPRKHPDKLPKVNTSSLSVLDDARTSGPIAVSDELQAKLRKRFVIDP